MGVDAYAAGSIGMGCAEGAFNAIGGLTSYFPCDSSTVCSFTCSRYRSRSSRAAATNFGSIFSFGAFSFLGLAGFAGASDSNRNRLSRIGFRWGDFAFRFVV